MASDQIQRTVEEAVERLRTSVSPTTSFVDFDLLNEEVYKQFHPFGMMGTDQIVALRLMPPGGRDDAMYALQGDKRITLDLIGPGKFVGFIPRNLPHHLPHDFGWWHLNGTEEFYFCIPLSDGNVCLLIFEANPIERVDTFAWYCQQCYAPLYARECNVGRVGLDGYWETKGVAVKAFNADMSLRTCTACDAVHPPAFSFFDPQEAKVW